MDISQRGLSMIKDYEGYSSEAYLCSERVPTIGWGSTMWDSRTPVKLGDKCSVEQAENLLIKEIRRIEDAIDNSVHVALSQGEFDCLCSWGFNVGTGWITGNGHQQATLIKYLNKGEKEKVPSELLKFKRGANTGNAIEGLLNRRKREIRELWLYEGDEQPVNTDPTVNPMPQAVAPERGDVKSLVAESWTIKGVIISGLAFVTDKFIGAYDWLFAVAKDAGPEILSLRTTVTPFDPLVKLTPFVLGGIVIAGLGIAAARRIKARQEGKEG